MIMGLFINKNKMIIIIFRLMGINLWRHIYVNLHFVLTAVNSFGKWNNLKCIKYSFEMDFANSKIYYILGELLVNKDINVKVIILKLIM